MSQVIMLWLYFWKKNKNKYTQTSLYAGYCSPDDVFDDL